MRLFETNLRDKIEAQPKLKLRDRRILAILDAPPSKRRDRRLAAMENHARAAIGANPNQASIDWENIDWQKFFETIMSLLLKLLPLILAI